MLIVGRKLHESLVIGEGENAVEVVLTESRPGGGVRLGIAGPRAVKVRRGELVHDEESPYFKECGRRSTDG